ncbi:MAG TPA: lysylphosphatidylglycerol synthase transmembrane domain-containing protein [Polyangiaceae bacterium]|nr:lysylphosphatidylglycerol synthase transmembrane domain-containing protein [Polyangiaceae bacterium]
MALGSDTPRAEVRPSRLRGVVSLVFLLVCVGYVGHVLYRERHELRAALELSAGAIAALFALNAVAHLQRTYEFTYMLRRLGVREPFGEGFLLTGAGFLLNHLPFNAGLVMRATVLKRDHALPYASYIALVMVNALVNVAMSAIIGLLCVAFAAARTRTEWPLVLMFGAMLLGSIGLAFVPSRWVPDRPGFVWNRLRTLGVGIGLVRGNASNLALLALLAFTKVVVAALRMWICFGALQAALSPLAAALLSSTTIVFSLINVTPGNLGLREVAMGAVSTLLGTSYDIGIGAASIDRAVLLLYTVASGLPGLYALRRRGPFKTSAAG